MSSIQSKLHNHGTDTASCPPSSWFATIGCNNACSDNRLFSRENPIPSRIRTGLRDFSRFAQDPQQNRGGETLFIYANPLRKEGHVTWPRTRTKRRANFQISCESAARKSEHTTLSSRGIISYPRLFAVRFQQDRALPDTRAR